MKSSTQVFASLVAALAMFSQPAIATYTYAERQFTVDRNAINVGTENRKSLLECSQAKPCVQDRIVIDSYKEVFSKSGKLQEAKIVLYNTSFAPASIEVISSDGKLRSVEFVDGAKAGFKDLGDFLKTASAGIIGPFQCTTNLFECLSDSRYGIEKNERTIKLQAGDLIRISRGSDAAFAYTLASSMVDQVELFASIPGIIPSKGSKGGDLSLLKNYSPKLKRKIIEGFIKDKMNSKYTWKMLLKEFGYETFKKSASNPQQLFDNALEITRNIPQDFWKKMMDGTVASTAAGDALDTLIQAVGAEGAVFLNSSLLVSQSVNIRARYSASELAHDKPIHIIIAGLKNSYINPNQPIATKPNTKISTSPDPIFKDIIPKIRRELPRDMVMRLPASIPNVYKEALNNGQGTQIYANNAEYSSDMDGGSYIVRLSRTPDCNATSCGVGSIYASRNKPSIRDSDSGNESKDKEESIQIKPGLSGYYFYARAGSAGYRHNIYWKQNGVYFHLNFRGFEKEEVRQMATSMSLGSVIRPSTQTKPIVRINSSIPNPSTSTSNSEDGCLIPTLPGIDVSNVKIVKNISSRDKMIEQYIRKAHADALNYKGSISYAYNKVDLDGDGTPEVLVRVLSSFCGSGGCPVDILKLNGGKYTAIDTSGLSWGRYIVTSNQTNGFKDIFYPHFVRNEKIYFLLKSSKRGSYQKVKEYTTNLKIRGTAYLVCGEYLSFSK
jgi:hypothetical protein